MGNRPVISKQQILDTAYAIAADSGLASLSVRRVAETCGVAVGTVYHSYPAKSDLVNDVIARFWNEALGTCMPKPDEGDDFVDFCRALTGRVSGALALFKSDWLAQVHALGAHDLASAREREEACFAHVRAGLAAVLVADPNIEHARLTGALSAERVAGFTWAGILSAAEHGDDGETLLALLRRSLY